MSTILSTLFAADYPFLDILWTMLIFFLWVMWFWLLIVIIGDVFRRRDIGGGKKTIWLIFILFVPFIGVLAYVLSNSDSMAERNMERAQGDQAQFDNYVRDDRRQRRRCRRDRQGEAAARLRRDHAGGVRRDQGQGARVSGPERRARMSELAPVDYLIVAFPGNQFKGRDRAGACGSRGEGNDPNHRPRLRRQGRGRQHRARSSSPTSIPRSGRASRTWASR